MSNIKSKNGFKIKNVKKDKNDFNLLSAFFWLKKI